nr:hypothetical protein [uncultured Porphyromonas sp.]
MTLTEEAYAATTPAGGENCLIDTAYDYTPKQLVGLLLSPRGIEHAIATGLPSLDFLRSKRSLLDGLPLTLLDEGEEVDLDAGRLAPVHAFVGGGRVVLRIDGDQLAGLQTIVLLHGVEATIYATGGSVVAVHRDDESIIHWHADESAITIEHGPSHPQR